MSEVDNVVLVLAGAEASQAENRLQSELGIPALTAQQLAENAGRFQLRYENSVLTLYCTDPDAAGGLSVNFDSSDLRRRRAESLKSQNSGKALGLKKLIAPRILDATAGFGTDSFLFAAAGCPVHLLERNPVVRALLRDGLYRASRSTADLAQIIAGMDLVGQDFLQYAAATDAYDVVYLDPMFPRKKKSARAGKAMHLLQQLITEPGDECALLEKALNIARKRVVVKRARWSEAVSGLQPDIVFPGRSNRFDVYLKH